MGATLSFCGGVLTAPGGVVPVFPDSAAATMFTPQNYARSTGSTAYKLPAFPAGVAVALYFQPLVAIAGSDNYLADLRTPGPLWYGQAVPPTGAIVDGALAAFGLSSFVVGKLSKAYFEGTLTGASSYLMCRYQAPFPGRMAMHNLYRVVVYSRMWTAAEKADTVTAGPTDSVLAIYDFSSMAYNSTTGVYTIPNVAPTAAGPLTVIGDAPVLY